MRHRGDSPASTCLTTRFDASGAMIFACWVPRYLPKHPIEKPEARERPIDPHPFYVPVVPMFGVQQFTPWVICTHEPFAPCSPWFCPACQATGWDWHPDMQLDADEAHDLAVSQYREHHRDNGRLTGGRGGQCRPWTVETSRGKARGFSFRKRAAWPVRPRRR
jgi:hypothetical protein